MDNLPCDGASVRRRSIPVILQWRIRRSIAADLEMNDDQSPISVQDEPILDNVGDPSPGPLHCVSDKPLAVSHVSKTRGFGDAQDMQNGGKP